MDTSYEIIIGNIPYDEIQSFKLGENPSIDEKMKWYFQ